MYRILVRKQKYTVNATIDNYRGTGTNFFYGIVRTFVHYNFPFYNKITLYRGKSFLHRKKDKGLWSRSDKR